MFWKPEGRRKRGRPKLTWRRTFQNDLDSRGVLLADAKSLAKDRTEWRKLACQCAIWHGHFSHRFRLADRRVDRRAAIFSPCFGSRCISTNNALSLRAEAL
ncbi:hypothetical protein Bbelb_088020 [Branchiostoma belcheri]|nr:hypothetical protein Bbelb_088020 [Branchiostoma belcheri]